MASRSYQLFCHNTLSRPTDGIRDNSIPRVLTLYYTDREWHANNKNRTYLYTIIHFICTVLWQLRAYALRAVTVSMSQRLSWGFMSHLMSEGKVRTLNRWSGKLNHLSMAYLLSNICTKNYWNWTTTVKIIGGGWVVYFFLDKVYIK